MPQIIANTEKLQALCSKDGRIVQIVFWEPGEVEFPGGKIFGADAPALVQVTIKENAGLELIVGNPTQKVQKLRIRLRGSCFGTQDHLEVTDRVVVFEFPRSAAKAGEPLKRFLKR